MINVEIAWLNRDFSNVFGSPAKTSVEFARSFYDAVFVWMGYDLLATLKASSSTAIYSAYFEATANMVYLFGVRLIVIVFSFPVFLFLGQSL